MDNFKFSDALLDDAYKIIAYSQCESDEERKLLEVVSNICKRYGIPFRKYMDAAAEINRLMEEWRDENTV